MKTCYALFPNVVCQHNTLISGIQCHSQSVGNNNFRLFLQKVCPTDEDQKATKKQWEVFRSHLVLAAYFAHKNPITTGQMLLWEEDEQKPQLETESDFCSLELLRPFLPNNLNPTALTAYWFARYLSLAPSNTRDRLVSLYNALGTLPCGFHGIACLNMSLQEKNLISDLLHYIKHLQQEEDNQDGTLPFIKPFSLEYTTAIEQLYIKQLLMAFPLLGHL